MEKMLQQLHDALQDSKATYVVIGGIAASILGKPRTTLDADNEVFYVHLWLKNKKAG